MGPIEYRMSERFEDVAMINELLKGFEAGNDWKGLVRYAIEHIEIFDGVNWSTMFKRLSDFPHKKEVRVTTTMTITM